MKGRIFRGLISSVFASLAFAAMANAQSTAPSISSLSLQQGPVAMGFVIQGAHFGATQGSSTVTLGSSMLTVISWSDSSITVQVPTGATTGSVVVTVSATASNGLNFTVASPFGCS